MIEDEIDSLRERVDALERSQREVATAIAAAFGGEMAADAERERRRANAAEQLLEDLRKFHMGLLATLQDVAEIVGIRRDAGLSRDKVLKAVKKAVEKRKAGR